MHELHKMNNGKDEEIAVSGVAASSCAVFGVPEKNVRADA